MGEYNYSVMCVGLGNIREWSVSGFGNKKGNPGNRWIGCGWIPELIWMQPVVRKGKLPALLEMKVRLLST
jgi:hypothetical protein